MHQGADEEGSEVVAEVEVTVVTEREGEAEVEDEVVLALPLLLVVHLKALRTGLTGARPCQSG